MSDDARLQPFWVRFYDNPTHLKLFEYHGPWWVSGTRGGWDDDVVVDSRDIIVAAVMATDEEAAQRVIVEAYDDKSGPAEWSFVNVKPADWAPFCARFARRSWMKWPWPTALASEEPKR